MSVVRGRDEQRSDEHFRMDGGPVVVPTGVDFKQLDELPEVELLVYLNEDIIGLYEISETLCRELKQRRVLTGAVQWV